MNLENGYINEDSTVLALVKHLGGTFEGWRERLKEDRCSTSDYRSFSCKKVGGQLLYERASVFQFIFQEAPEALGLGRALGIGTVDGSSFACSASHAVNYERSGEVVVELDFSRSFSGRALMSPEAARKLAAQLIDAAAICETHALDIVSWKIKPRDQLRDFSKLGLCTGDLELDLLLAECDAGDTKKKNARAKKATAR